MSQTDELSRVKARIKALTDKTVANGCTEAEAMSAAEMVGRLLERYALSMDEIEVRSARCVQVEVHLGSRRRRPIDGCVPAIARFCDCKVWLAPAGRPDPDDPYKPICRNPLIRRLCGNQNKYPVMSRLWHLNHLINRNFVRGPRLQIKGPVYRSKEIVSCRKVANSDSYT